MNYVENLIKKTGLFESLGDEEFSELCKRSERLKVPAGRNILFEGDSGQELYIVQDGHLEAYTKGEDGKPIVLGHISPGEYVGEQTILSQEDEKRIVSVRAFSNSTLIKISKEDFQNALLKNPYLKDTLLHRQMKQFKHITESKSLLLHVLKIGEENGWHEERSYSEGETIFAQNSLSRSFYYIRSGSVGLFQQNEAGNRRMIALLEAGQCFGEGVLSNHDLERLDAVALEGLKVIAIEAFNFARLCEQFPELRNHIHSLSETYAVMDHSFNVSNVSRSTDADTTTTVYHIPGNKIVVTSHSTDGNTFHLMIKGMEAARMKTVRFESPDGEIRRELNLANNRIVAASISGPWKGLGKLHDIAINQKLLSGELIENFVRTGNLVRDEENMLRFFDNDIVCNCMQVTYGELNRQIDQGRHTVKDLVELTGVGTVCGSCRPLLNKLKQKERTGWIRATLMGAFEVAPDVYTFRFAPFRSKLESMRPGQHIILRTELDGSWVQRPYTITSSAQEKKYREITVKREPKGLFSSWLVSSHLQTESLIYFSPPMGDDAVDITSENPVVCLVGGIGMTRILSPLRTLLRSGRSKPNMHINYSTNKRSNFVYREELEAADKNHDNISVRLRVTEEEGRLDFKEVSEIVRKYEKATFYVCGPRSYNEDVRSYLKRCNVPDERVSIEVYSHHLVAKQIKEGKKYLYAGLAMSLLFFFQDIFHWKWPWLEWLQSNDIYRVGSGFLLTLFIALQWRMPVLRLLGRAKSAALRYEQHKKQGILAPLVYYLHSTHFGYAYLFTLSVSYIANVVLGFLNRDLLSESKFIERYSYYWLITHVALSMFVLALMLYHIFIVVYY